METVTETKREVEPEGPRVDESASGLPPWGRDDLPEPLPFGLRNLFKTIGPGAILLATSIGGGEWLVGPATSVQYGVGLFWIATVAILLQLVFNLEAIRYTLYTGEPIYSGFMRLKPRSGFWATAYVILTAMQLGIPAVAAACAAPLFAAFAGRMPGAPDAGVLVWVTYGVIAVTVLILLLGGTIERTLERVSWAMLGYIFVFLVGVNLFFVPLGHWWHTLQGFFSFGHMPSGVDITLLGALAATAGQGGVGNLTITNWIRDKGFGMGSRVGAIPGAFGSREVKLSHTGKVFPVTGENLRRWRQWWKYAAADQVWLWGGGCFVGMFLNINLATYIMPQGTDISRVGAGAFQAQYMAEHLWAGFWFLALLNGFWILFSTHLGNTDLLVRTITDIVWVGSPSARAWRGGDIRRIYYGILFGFTAWGLFAVNRGDAMGLFKIIANMAGVVLAIASVQLLIVGYRLLPREIQPPAWRRAVLALCALFYMTFSALVIWSQIKPLFQ
ncbi:MAG TPA: Nramp family divalent metal transporter [Pyrinomonadaceae bacterium]|nr:Nramp family divalent metal transporter [Pyrinomonadaceae bacterium]